MRRPSTNYSTTSSVLFRYLLNCYLHNFLKFTYAHSARLIAKGTSSEDEESRQGNQKQVNKLKKLNPVFCKSVIKSSIKNGASYMLQMVKSFHYKYQCICK